MRNKLSKGQKTISVERGNDFEEHRNSKSALQLQNVITPDCYGQPPAVLFERLSEENFNKRQEGLLASKRAENEIIDAVISQMYLSKRRPSIRYIHFEIVRRIFQENGVRGDDKLAVPKYNAVYRRVRNLDPCKIIRTRYGKRLADMNSELIKYQK